MFNYPPRLNPVYSMPSPNDPIPLYNGPMKFLREGITVQGDGRLDFEWLPSPGIRFKIDQASPPPRTSLKQLLGKGTLSLLDADTEVSIDAVASGLSIPTDSFEMKVVGYPEKAIVLGADQNLSYVLCHFVNLPNFLGEAVSYRSGEAFTESRSRVVLEADGWRIIIDAVEEISKLIKDLKASGGYAITHVAKLERSDGGTVSSDDVKEWIDALAFFLSFARGFHSPPILSVGFDEEGNKVWEEWYSKRRSTPWKGVISWFPESRPQGLVRIFPNFMDKWNDQTWNEGLRQVITWYVDSNSATSNIEGLIIWIHSALEILFWIYFIEQGPKSKSTFEKKKLTELLTMLIDEFSIPQTLPTSLPNLTQLAQKNPKWIDGPCTFVEVRSSIVHPNWRSKVFSSSEQDLYRQARREAWDLGMWYLEMVLLKLFDYQGDYFNRRRLWEDDRNIDLEPFP